MTKFLNISVDTTLGGNSASDNVVSSQKAIKGYIDNIIGSLYPVGCLYYTVETSCPLSSVIGTWEKLGSQEKSLFGQENTDEIIYVFKRIS